MEKEILIEKFKTLYTKKVETNAFQINSAINFEEKYRIRLPDSLKMWLQISNGSYLGMGGVYGLNNGVRHLEIETYLNFYPVWIEKKWIPISGDGCGNSYVMVSDPNDDMYESICFIDTSENDEDISYVVASDIWHFIQFQIDFEYGEKRWPFIEEYVIAVDPAILKYNDFLPWKS